LIQSELGNDWDILTIEKYHKYDNSYKIEFKKTFIENHPDKINHLAISLTDKLLSPWLLYYDKDERYIELVYNKYENARIRKIDFDVIKWGHLQITKQ
jgi:hypothetical protein